MKTLLFALFLVAIPSTAEAQYLQWYEPPLPIAEAIDTAAEHWGVRSQFLRCLAWEESRYQPDAWNRAGYHGLMQFDWQTWSYGSRLAGLEGASPYDVWAASEVAAFLIWRGEVSPWPTRFRCGSPWD